MKKTTLLVLVTLVAGSVFATSAMADASRGKMVYMKKLKHICKKDAVKNGGVFAIKHNRRTWASLKKNGKLQEEWMKICPHGVKKIKKMKPKNINNLYDFVWKYASDGEVPSCG